MSIVKSEFTLALNQVATEKGISVEEVIASIESAVLAAYHKQMHEAGVPMPDSEAPIDESITVRVNRDSGESHVYKDGKDITPAGFGRIATQTAKQVILQKLREAEKKTVLGHFRGLIGTVQRGRVIRYDGFNAYVDIGRVEATLPKDEQIRNEKYTVNAGFLFYIKEIIEDKFGNSRIIVSRSHPDFILELFKREVPEIANNTVEIKKVVREPGERAKIAVHSSQGGVDPVGACVGQKGIRVQTVTNELGGEEKIDIIPWSSDDKQFISSALSPAKITETVLEKSDDKEIKRAKVTVEESQAPLAIGKNGINVNLASKLTGYEIDIVQIASSETPSIEAGSEAAAPADTAHAENGPADNSASTESEQPETEKKDESVQQVS